MPHVYWRSSSIKTLHTTANLLADVPHNIEVPLPCHRRRHDRTPPSFLIGTIAVFVSFGVFALRNRDISVISSVYHSIRWIVRPSLINDRRSLLNIVCGLVSKHITLTRHYPFVIKRITEILVHIGNNPWCDRPAAVNYGCHTCIITVYLFS